MKLDHANVYIKKKEQGYVLCIEIPDQRNYLHSSLEPLGVILQYEQDILEQTIGNWNTIIKEDGTYYRLQISLAVGKQINGINDQELIFHSRKLNLNDAEFDYFTVIQNSDEQMVNTVNGMED